MWFGFFKKSFEIRKSKTSLVANQQASETIWIIQMRERERERK